MIRSTLSSALRPILLGAAISGAMIAPAMADGYVKEAVTLNFDEAALTDYSQAESELKSLRLQAKDACTSVSPITRVSLVDQDCVVDVLDQAITAIDHPVLNTVYADAGLSNKEVRIAALD